MRRNALEGARIRAGDRDPQPVAGWHPCGDRKQPDLEIDRNARERAGSLTRERMYGAKRIDPAGRAVRRAKLTFGQVGHFSAGRHCL